MTGPELDALPGPQADLRTLAHDLIGRLESTGAVPGIAVGEQAPPFTLSDALGGEVSLDQRLASGPVVVVFYRGAWCPHCDLHLRSLQDRLADFIARRATLVAISPQAPDASLTFAQRLALGFDVLSDVDQSVIRSWRLWFELPESMRDHYRHMGMALDVHNADGTWGLPVPATFVLDQTGTVRARHVDPNYRHRMTAEDILAALDHIIDTQEAAG